MNKKLKELFDAVAEGKISVEEASTEADKVCAKGFEDLKFAHVDWDRQRRCGFPEVILAQGKTSEQVVKIARSILAHNPLVLITRVNEETAQAVLADNPQADYNQAARTIVMGTTPEPDEEAGTIIIVCAGTSDLPVAEEAYVTAKLSGFKTKLIADVGVAGLHRLLSHSDELKEAIAIVAVAGMEGALPSVIGGLVSCPVIAVPTSTGYGAAFGGIAALLGMLNSCASGVSVVNIDNGFGAGFMAGRIAMTARRFRNDDKN